MDKLLIKIASVLLLVPTLIGFGAYTARIENKRFASDADYYKELSTELSVLGIHDEAGYGTFFCYVTIVCPIAVLVSVPVDFAVDTLLLLYDYVYAD